MNVSIHRVGVALLSLLFFIETTATAQETDASVLAKGAYIEGGLSALQAVVPKGELPGKKLPFYTRSDGGERYLVGGLVVNMMARAADTGDLYEWTVITGGKGAMLPSHTHAQTHEAIMVLDGEVELWLADKHYRLIKGDFASVPPGIPHAFKMMAHHTQLVSMTNGNQMGALYRSLGKPYAGYVQPSDEVPALDQVILKNAERVADVRFDSKPLASGNTERVTNAQLPKSAVPYVLAVGEGDHYTIGNELFGVLCDNATTNNKLLVVTTEGPATQMIIKHYHLKHSEAFFCIDGQLRMIANQSTIDAYPGDFVSVPAGTIHAYQLIKPYTRFMGLLTPGIFELFFRSQKPYSQHVYPQGPGGPPNFSRMAELDLVPLEMPGPPPGAPKH
ncbi:quercetin 2,3-dioxygenase [Spirosoma linguale]|uniref:Cupin 2 conserved barrel domain protein n=1 Tax=Spirosoma linguale (strain ATCC 33905 / DSM 74 / LMG 10896 / Claus 1) TaxID=504472 RepID=D2QIY7_SPILD|nr:Cupin 2 conserved barrel domain protein [Spirosoma linguale DSM 74]